MRGFFGMPNRGGKLTIANCLIWVIVVIGIVTNSSPLQLPEIAVCWPVAWLFILLTSPDGRRWSTDGAVFVCVGIGLNSFLWGYGISWFLSLPQKWRRGQNIERRGFEVITPAGSPGPDRDAGGQP
jgi:hypothetical protein